jgi:hypothetical protein
VVEDELIELTRISDHIFAIIDSERNAQGANIERGRRAFVELCIRLKIDCCTLDRRATENYFTDAAVKKVYGDKFSALDPYQKLSDVAPNWSKEENWRIAREMSREEIGITDLGGFLERLANSPGNALVKAGPQ